MSGEGRSITKSCEIKVAKILGITWVDGEGNQITNIRDSKGGKVFISIQTENHHCTDKDIILRVYEYNFGRADTKIKIDGKQFKVEISPKDLEPNGSIKVEFLYEKLPFAEYWERVLEFKQWEFYCTTEWGGTNAQEIKWRKRRKSNVLDMPLDRFNSYELELIEMFYGNDYGFKNYLKNDIFLIRWTFAEIEKANAKKGLPPSEPRAFSIPSIIGTPLVTADSKLEDKATFIHEIFHQYQYQHGTSVNFAFLNLEWNLETPVSLAFWNLIGEQCQYEKYRKSGYKGMNPYNYSSFFTKPRGDKKYELWRYTVIPMELREEDITEKIQDIETYEGQAQFMGDVARVILEKKKDYGRKLIDKKRIFLTEGEIYIDGYIIAKILKNSNLNNASKLLINSLK